MRAFIAIELPPDVRHALARLQGELAASGADVAWVAEPNLHVTMRFFGEITEAQQQAIADLVRRVAQQTPLVRVALSDLGAFPSLTSPRVIWVGIGAGQEVLRQLAEQLEEGFARLDLPGEARAFVAHVTLGRVRSSRHRAALVTLLQQIVWTPPATFDADHLTLFQSTLSGSGPTYAPLATLPFAPPAR